MFLAVFVMKVYIQAAGIRATLGKLKVWSTLIKLQYYEKYVVKNLQWNVIK